MPQPNHKAMMADPKVFRESLKIDTSRGHKWLVDVLDDWQRADFEAMDRGWRNVVFRDDPDCIKRSYKGRPRGHAKTSDQAIPVVWALYASPKHRRLTGNVLAGDQEQATLLAEAIQMLVDCNPWLKQFTHVQRFKVVNPITGSKMSILASDAFTTFGQRPDFVSCDEITHWRGKLGKELWTTTFSAVGKKAHCVLEVQTNAGEEKSWQQAIRDAARSSDDWHYSDLDGPKASWITQAMLDEQRNFLPPSAYRRLWDNKWTKGGGDALEASDISLAITQPGPMAGTEPGYLFAAGLDLGIKHDHSAIFGGATVPGSGRVKMACCESWKPGPPDGQVRIKDIEAYIIKAHQRYNFTFIAFDPNQAIYLAQRLQDKGIPMLEVPFTGKLVDTMARDLLQAFRGRSLDLYRDDMLIDDLHELTIVPRSYGHKLEAPSGERGHADRAFAMAIILPLLLEGANDAPVVPAETKEPEIEGFSL